MKKIAALLLAVALLNALNVTAYAETAEVDTNVPGMHTVTFVFEGGGGGVVMDDEPVTDFIQIERQKSQPYVIIPDEGYEFDKIYYNGEDVTFLTKDGIFTAPPITSDSQLTVIFKQLAVESSLPEQESQDSESESEPESEPSEQESSEEESKQETDGEISRIPDQSSEDTPQSSISKPTQPNTAPPVRYTNAAKQNGDDTHVIATGENSIFSIVLAVLSLAGLIISVILPFGRKNRKNK